MEATHETVNQQQSCCAPASPITIDELRARAGEELGVSAYHEVTQVAINAFAQATGDHQWIDTDPERAAETHGAQLNVKLTFECDATEKPVCVAQALYRVFEAGPAL